MSLYNAKSSDGGLRITKFDEELQVESSYITTPHSCECPAGVRDTCRHRQMYPEFIETSRFNTPWFLEYDNQRWFYYNSETGLLTDHEPKLEWPRRRL